MMKFKFLSLFIALLTATCAFGQNPIVQTMFTPDPAPYAHGDTVYLFTDHDEDDAQYFKMKDWLLYSTTDMVNWTYRGTPMSTATFKWAKQGDNAWAAQAVERNGKWYWYVCAEDTTKHLHGIGVAVADQPEGPYTDPLGKPLVPGDWGYIDPTVFIDDDGQAYLFWGNNGAWYVPLREDMISLAGEVKPVPGLNDPEAFGPLKKKYDYQIGAETLKTNYEEGPWVIKRNGIYYMVYAAGGVPEHLAYSTASDINGPWHYGGRIMDEAEGSFTIHGGSVEFQGRDFMFYHNGMLPNGGGFRRSTCVEEFTWNPDGSLPHIPFTKEGVTVPTSHLCPYERVEAETMADSYGLKVDRTTGTRHYLTHIDNGDWLRLRSVDFAEGGASRLTACVAAETEGTCKREQNRTCSSFAECSRSSTKSQGGSIELRLDNLGGPIVGLLNVQPTGGTDHWELQQGTVETEKLTGVHDLYLLFHGGDEEGLFRLDYWQLEK